MTAVRCKQDSSRIGIGSLCGSVDVFDVCFKKSMYQGRFEFTYVSFFRSSSRILTHLKDSFLNLPKAKRSPRSTSIDSDTKLPTLTALSFWEILRPARFLNSHGEEIVMRSMTSPTQISALSSTSESSLSLSTVSTRSSEPTEPRIWAKYDFSASELLRPGA